ncbi:SAM-dependent methyltransferase, partial [Terribacillus saccharophilus]|uniref:methyltransferase n=1 Tax=Terribacillus saccharophilus TaxID=361277 RepID=UPI000BDCD6D9
SPHYERATILLYDFFGFRKDAFDRLQNEQTYLTDMNNGQDHKRIISDYAKGTLMLDIGAGGGVMLDILSEDHPEAEVVGIDVSTNVIEELNRRKTRENKRWQVKQADALELKEYYDPGSVDTIVFSSILHEMFSYIPYKGKKFNPEVVIQALKSAFEVLNDGGRIIIRDGIMTEPKDDMRYLEFKDEKGYEFFKRYVKDFKGREIAYEVVNDVHIKLSVNDAMEFLYTYTWGEEAYPHEVQEQFGYYTPSEYKKAVEEALGDKARIIAFKHYLQDGYEEFLSSKVKVMDEQGVEGLPDSTCFIVIEKA